MTRTAHGRWHGHRQDPSRSRWTDPPGRGPVVFDPSLRTAAELAARGWAGGEPPVTEGPAGLPEAREPEAAHLRGGREP